MNDYDDIIVQLEEAIKRAAEGHFILKLYVSGSSTRSAKAIANVQTLCNEHLADRYELEIIDVFQQPELASEMQLVAAPTLVKEQPEPVRRIVGDMSNEDRVLHSLNIIRKPI